MKIQTFDGYQEQATRTAVYPNVGTNMVYPALGVAEEAGEVAGKVKKFWRNLGVMNPNQLNTEQKLTVMKEMGDVLWYMAALATELKVDLSLIASQNIEKLLDRQARGVIKGEGDNR